MNEQFSRRGLLIGGFGAAATVAGLTLAGTDAEPAPNRADPRPVEHRPVLRDTVYSHARERKVHMEITAPSGVSPEGLPVCLLLHGLHGDADGILPGLAPRMAEKMNGGGLPPFAFAALDGGDDYWHREHSGDDPMRMLLDEAPGWLAERGFRAEPFAAAGVSMGGFGALLYARRRVERGRPVRAVAAISPGLMFSWNKMRKRRAFDGPEQWERLDPLRNIEALHSVPTGIWCGKSDPFVTGARRYIQLARPEFHEIRKGKHNGKFFGSCVPDLLEFLGKHTPTYGPEGNG